MAIALTGADDAGETALLLTRRASGLRAHRAQWALPGGRCDAGETQVQSALRELHEELGLDLATDAVLGLLDDYPTRSGYLITPVVVWAGREAHGRAEPGGGRLRAPRFALGTIEHERRLRFHRHSRERAAGDPLSLGRAADPCADGGDDLSVPRGAGRARHARRRSGTTGVCLEVAAVWVTTSPCAAQTIRYSRADFVCARVMCAQPVRRAPIRQRLPRRLRREAIARLISGRLAEYQAAREAYEADAGAYWSAIAEKRRGRNAKRREHQQVTLDDYVLTQPPVYAGPKRPVNPAGRTRAGSDAAPQQDRSPSSPIS